MGEVHIPIIDEDKLDDIITAIQALSSPSGTDVAISPTGMHIVTEDDVQGAISELDSAVDSVNASLTQLVKVVNFSLGTNIAFTAGERKELTGTVTEAGYTPIGIVGINKTGTGKGFICVSDYNIGSGTGSYTVSLTNTDTNARTLTTCNMKVEFVKSDFVG